jgi:hypothetical protein
MQSPPFSNKKSVLACHRTAKLFGQPPSNNGVAIAEALSRN